MMSEDAMNSVCRAEKVVPRSFLGTFIQSFKQTILIVDKQQAALYRLADQCKQISFFLERSENQKLVLFVVAILRKRRT